MNYESIQVAHAFLKKEIFKRKNPKIKLDQTASNTLEEPSI